MKKIDVKSLLIGILLTTTVIFGIGATSPTDKWDDEQQWTVWTVNSVWLGKTDEWLKQSKGGEPFSIQGKNVLFRKRVK